MLSVSHNSPFNKAMETSLFSFSENKTQIQFRFKQNVKNLRNIWKGNNTENQFLYIVIIRIQQDV